MAVLVLHQALGLGFGVLCPRTESFVKCEAFFTNQASGYTAIELLRGGGLSRSGSDNADPLGSPQLLTALQYGWISAGPIAALVSSLSRLLDFGPILYIFVFAKKMLADKQGNPRSCASRS
jgi:hypothetical protein